MTVGLPGLFRGVIDTPDRIPSNLIVSGQHRPLLLQCNEVFQ
jgi:hypothetical protein